MLYLVFTWDNHGTLEALSESMGKENTKSVCHNDPVLHAEFKEMMSYIHHIQGTFAKVMIGLFFTIVLGTFLFTTFYKYFVCDKYFEEPQKKVKQSDSSDSSDDSDNKKD